MWHLFYLLKACGNDNSNVLWFGQEKIGINHKMLWFISKIISCYKGLSVQPKFENVEGAFRVILPNTHALGISVGEEKYLPILRLFDKQKEITRGDVEEALGVGTTYAINMLKEMLEKGLIKKVGNGRRTRYVVK